MIPRPLSSLYLVLSPLALLMMSSACDATSREQTGRERLRWSDTPTAPTSGPVFEDEDFTLSVKQPQICAKTGPMAPVPGTKRLSVPLEVRGSTARQVPVSALLFTLEDAKGHEFRPTLAGCQPALVSRNIARNEKVAGEVAFDVPVDLGAAELRFEPFLIGRKKVTARVKVPAPTK